MSTPSADIALQLNPVVGSVLDKRSYGTALDRPSALNSGVGLLRYEDKADSSATYADWPKWVFWDGAAWQDLQTIDPSTLYTGQVDMSAVSASNAIVRSAVGAVSEGTTKSALESLTVSNLLAQILDVGPEVGIMPVATGVGAVFLQAPTDAQIGTTHTFNGRIQFTPGSYSPPRTTGATFPAGNATGVTMTNPYTGLPQSIALANAGVPNIYGFSSTHEIPIALETVVVNDAVVAHNAGGAAFNNIGETITSTLPAGRVTVPALTLRSYALVLREPVSVDAQGNFVRDGGGNLTFGLAAEDNSPSAGSGQAATQRVYANTTSIVVTSYNRESTFLVLTSKFKSDATLEVYDAVFGWRAQSSSTWTSEDITVGSASIPYTRIHMPALQLPSDVRFEVNSI